LNEEQNIRYCLESATWADEIVVIDAGSVDRTIEIVKSFDVKLFHRKWTGYVDQKNFALSKAEGDWVLSLDADEIISEDLRKDMIALMDRGAEKDGYTVPRLSYYQNRWVRHSGFYPDRQLRFFKRLQTHWVGGRVHERAEVRGVVGRLKANLFHFPYKGSIVGQIRTMNNFTTLQAEDLYEKGKRYHLFLILFRPFFKFLEIYFFKLGFLDGLAGLIIAGTFSYSMFVRYIKLRELDTRFHQRPGL
jgi:glycosyltransferase involved in cell wall biosynthesis